MALIDKDANKQKSKNVKNLAEKFILKVGCNGVHRYGFYILGLQKYQIYSEYLSQTLFQTHTYPHFLSLSIDYQQIEKYF